MRLRSELEKYAKSQNSILHHLNLLLEPQKKAIEYPGVDQANTRKQEMQHYPQGLDKPFFPIKHNIIPPYTCNFADCSDGPDGEDFPDGVRDIHPRIGSEDVIQAFCSGGLTVFQNRADGSQSFDQEWEGYTRGFGNPRGKNIITLINIHQ